MGPVDGEELTSTLERSGPWNAHFGGNAIAIPDDDPLPRIELAGDLTLTLLAPGGDELRALKPVWEREVRRAGLVPGQGVLQHSTQLRDDVEALGAGIPDVPRLAVAGATEDAAIPNRASIVLLLEHAGCAVLCCGDAWPGVVARGLRRLLVERDIETLALSALKVPHHGSKYNLTSGLLDVIDSRELSLLDRRHWNSSSTSGSSCARNSHRWRQATLVQLSERME